MNADDFQIFLEDFTNCVNELEDSYDNALRAIRKLKEQIAKLMGLSEEPVGRVAVREETFVCLNFEATKGDRIGAFEVTGRDKNDENRWLPAYNILKQANASINNRYYGRGYKHGYWLYNEKIYRQKLKSQQ